MTDYVPVVLAGGSGTRLWPLSREFYPKQLLSRGGEHSLLQRTLLRRGDGPQTLGAPMVVCNEEHRFHVLDQADAVGVELREVLIEPQGRNTAPALTAAALRLPGDAVLVMMPADHVFDDEAGFVHCLATACAEADAGRIALIGCPPSGAETGYGYIRCAAPAAAGHAVPIDDFVEKPDAHRAEAFVQSGCYLWNTGVYVLRAAVWLSAIRHFRPDILAACEAAVAEGEADGRFFRVRPQAFLNSPSDSVDYAVMQRVATDPAFRCCVVAYGSGWSDMGSWPAVYAQGRRDAAGNVTAGDAVVRDAGNCLVMSEGRLVAVLGCEDLVIAETADAVLVADMGAARELSGLVQDLKERAREEVLLHRRVHRPWGSYETLVSGDHYQVKRLTVKPGRSLSLQLHRQRAEHWIVVRGTAAVIRGDECMTLQPNESLYIPSHTKHRLGNPGEAPLEVIEVQTGDYLGEDDIVRFDDDFGRHTR